MTVPPSEGRSNMSWPSSSVASDGPLSGVRVLDLSAYAVGPWSASLLAMLGADVIKVDPPYGDPIRAVRPQLNGEPTTYTTSNQGKRCVVLDLKAPGDREIATALAMSADLLVENFRAGALDRLGLGYAALSKLNPRLVVCSSGSFGDKGPMATAGSTDPHGQAFNGFVSVNGVRGGDPEFLRYKAVVDLATSAYLAASALLGLQYRARFGTGCHFETSQMEGALAIQINRIAEYFGSGTSPQPYGSGVAWLVPSGAYRCRDGAYLNVTAPAEAAWVALCREIGRDDLAERADLASNAGRVEHRDEIDAAIAAAIGTRDIHWWRQRLTLAGVPNGEYFILDEAARFGAGHPLAPFIERVPHPLGGTIASGGPPWRFNRTPVRISRAPLPGEHDAQVRAAAVSAPTTNGAVNGNVVSGRGPLAGLKVLDLSQGVAGPYCGLLLAGTGAEVLKLEPPSGDPQRRLGPPFIGESSASYLSLNRGKHVARDDWRSAEAARTLEALLAAADVVVIDRGKNGFEPVVDWQGAELASNPRAIVCGISPAGEEGPLSGSPATELEVQASSGMLRYLGSIDSPPVRLGADVGSVLAGTFGFQAILAALYERERSGRGQYVAVSSVGALVAMETVMIAALTQPDAWDGFHCLAATFGPEHGVKTADGAVSFNAPRRSDDAWLAFAEEVGATELTRRPEFDTEAKRVANGRELGDAIEPCLQKFSTRDVVEITIRHGGIAVPVQNYADYFAHPQAAAMEVADEWQAESGERFTALAMPWRLDGTRPRPGRAPATGALGDSQSAIEAWLAEQGRAASVADAVEGRRAG
jgi:crotonobetainyl-CoA:carnitine CoA-transferase CaiB-like acyl-CoA transferase